MNSSGPLTTRKHLRRVNKLYALGALPKCSCQAFIKHTQKTRPRNYYPSRKFIHFERESTAKGIRPISFVFFIHARAVLDQKLVSLRFLFARALRIRFQCM